MDLFDRLVDQPLLRAANTGVQYYNWLSGKNQFACARFVARCGYGCLFLLDVVVGSFRFGDNPESIQYSIGGLVFSLAFYIGGALPLIRRVERMRGEEQVLNMKWIGAEMSLVRERTIWFSMFFLYTAVLRDVEEMSVRIALMVVLAYIVSVDAPPFVKNQARDYLRGRFQFSLPRSESLPTPN